MKIIVMAHPKDDHAAPVLWALGQAGYQTACWSGVSPAEQDQASLLVDEHSCIKLGTQWLESDDVFWLRQADHQASDDQAPEHQAADPTAAEPAKGGAPTPSFFDELAYMFESLPVRCVNPYSAMHFVRNKAVQLSLARRAGLKIPEALFSNSPAAVRNFFDRYPNDAICKAFATHVWQQQGSTDVM